MPKDDMRALTSACDLDELRAAGFKFFDFMPDRPSPHEGAIWTWKQVDVVGFDFDGKVAAVRPVSVGLSSVMGKFGGLWKGVKTVGVPILKETPVLYTLAKGYNHNDRRANKLAEQAQQQQPARQ